MKSIVIIIIIIIAITTKLKKKNNCFALDTTSLNFGALIRKKRKRFKFLNPPERLKLFFIFQSMASSS